MANKRILVVDDSCLYQRLLSDVMNAHDGLEVAGVAPNGKIALSMIQRTQPDLVTLDILMPEMDGIETLMQICKRWPTIKTIVLSSLSSDTSDVALDALALGAAEYAVKPVASGDVNSFRSALKADLLPKIEALCGLDKKAAVDNRVFKTTTSSNLPVTALSSASNETVVAEGQGIQLVAIGVSTGGPEALATMLSQLPVDIGVPIVIVQHMPAAFTTKLAKRLNTASALTVVEAQAGDRIRTGTVYIAPGDYHMVLEQIEDDVVIKLNREEPENSCRPSVDPLFRSIPAIYANRCLGVILTGMGADGLSGCAALHAAGCPIIVQDKESSVVWGMPKIVAMEGYAQQQVPLQQMAAVVTKFVKGLSRSQSRSAANADNYKKAINSGRGS